MQPSFNHLFRLIALLTALAASGCASINTDYPKQPSTALADFEGTWLDGVVEPYEDSHPGQSGFYIQYDGIDALAARLLLARKAQATIDAQYYLITNDTVGFIFLGSLMQAADRGVRVRLLVDDIQTKGYDAGMAALDSHPNLEVRIFNPFASRSFRVADAITGFSRINRRMHNKSFTADNQITIIGGRNIANEYFGAHSEVNFGDVDVMAVGPVVRDVSEMFDMYWNHGSALPVPAFAKMPADPEAAQLELRAAIEQKVDAARTTKYGDAVIEDYENYLQSTMNLFSWADYALAYDSPDKVSKQAANSGDIKTIASTLATAIESSQSELIIISPYFVPRKQGIAYLKDLRARDIDVTIITNSLAATNHDIVHSGYAPSRKPLLEAGVRIFEIKTTSGVSGIERGGRGDSLATLHTKAFVVDCEALFVGSFNWDPRSLNINTELGVIINSEELADGVCQLIDDKQDEKAYEVILNDQGDLNWIDSSGPETVVLTTEPDTGWWRRFKVSLMRMLPVKSQL